MIHSVSHHRAPLPFGKHKSCLCSLFSLNFPFHHIWQIHLTMKTTLDLFQQKLHWKYVRLSVLYSQFTIDLAQMVQRCGRVHIQRAGFTAYDQSQTWTSVLAAEQYIWQWGSSYYNRVDLTMYAHCVYDTMNNVLVLFFQVLGIN